jgi:hypothetical protein
MAHTPIEASVLAPDYAGRDTWKKLFGYTVVEADAAIKAHFKDASREVIYNEQFERIRSFSNLDHSHDKESFAHYLKCSETNMAGFSQRQPAGRGVDRKQDQKYLVVRLTKALEAADVQRIKGLVEPPRALESEPGEPTAPVVDSNTRAALENSLPELLKFLPLSGPRAAGEDLSPSSMALTLGIDATLPQHHLLPSPYREQHPVPCFFHGTLADREQLRHVL